MDQSPVRTSGDRALLLASGSVLLGLVATYLVLGFDFDTAVVGTSLSGVASIALCIFALRQSPRIAVRVLSTIALVVSVGSLALLIWWAFALTQP